MNRSIAEGDNDCVDEGDELGGGLYGDDNTFENEDSIRIRCDNGDIAEDRG